jgi:response regulator NasT
VTAHTTDEQHPPAERRLRVLVGEDETLIRLDLVRLVEAAGHLVVGEASDGGALVRLAREVAPDLVLTDVRMPVLDGLEATRRIVAERPVPVVVLTAFPHAEIVHRSAEVGAFAHLSKPFRESDLRAAIELAAARFDELEARRAEADALLDALDRRRVVERARDLAARERQITPQAALDGMVAVADAAGLPLPAVAEALLETLDDG